MRGSEADRNGGHTGVLWRTALGRNVSRNVVCVAGFVVNCTAGLAWGLLLAWVRDGLGMSGSQRNTASAWYDLLKVRPKPRDRNCDRTRVRHESSRVLRLTFSTSSRTCNSALQSIPSERGLALCPLGLKALCRCRPSAGRLQTAVSASLLNRTSRLLTHISMRFRVCRNFSSGCYQIASAGSRPSSWVPSASRVAFLLQPSAWASAPTLMPQRNLRTHCSGF